VSNNVIKLPQLTSALQLTRLGKIYSLRRHTLLRHTHGGCDESFDDNSSGIFRNRLFFFLVKRIIWSLNLGIVRAKRKNKLLFFHNEEIMFI
jgi:hypothetical protein